MSPIFINVLLITVFAAATAVLALVTAASFASFGEAASTAILLLDGLALGGPLATAATLALPVPLAAVLLDALAATLADVDFAALAAGLADVEFEAFAARLLDDALVAIGTATLLAATGTPL
jgi:hypothetical protein